MENFNLLPLQPLASRLTGDLIPYLIILTNVLIFKLMRKLINKVVNYFYNQQDGKSRQRRQEVVDINKLNGKLKFLKLLGDELISTCELCCCCAELNVVYERHGSLAYGLILFLLTCCWLDTFGEAHTTPGYIIEDYFLFKGNRLFQNVDFYARFLGQTLAMPLAWRFASFYWTYRLLKEHGELLLVENCKSSLTTTTTNGFLIEFVCSLICRLIELVGSRLLERKSLGQRNYTIFNSFISSLLVVLALDLSGGYFNPVLASSLEFNCHGSTLSQHALVFWAGPLLGHLAARQLYRKCMGDWDAARLQSKPATVGAGNRRRSTRSSKKSD